MTRRPVTLVLALLVGLFLLALCGILGVSSAWSEGRPPPAPLSAWQSPGLRSHPLSGLLWEAREGREADPVELRLRLSRVRFVLLGEVHDNPDHHLLEAWALTAVPRQHPAVFEMLSEDQRPQIDKFYELREARKDLPPAGAAGELARLLAWDNSGWPPFALYAPVFIRAIEQEARLVVGTPSRERTRAVSKAGLTALEPSERRRLGLDAPLPSALGADLEAELRESHCNRLPDAALGRMAGVQRFRDAVMADALLAAAAAGGVLIAGNGHIRRDRGVPFILERRNVPAADIVTVMFAEVEEGQNAPMAYVPRTPTGAAAVDWLWLTPRAEREDPCASLQSRQEQNGATGKAAGP